MKQEIQKIIFKGVLFLLLVFSIGLFGGEVQGKCNFTIGPNSKPYKNQNVNAKPYNKYTKQYIMINTYLDQMAKKGGGTLTLKKGTYNLTNALFVPSNTTIILKDGVVLNKKDNTHTKYIKASHVMFEFVRHTRATKTKVLGKYNGEKNIKIIGKGSAKIQMNGSAKSEGMRVPHCSNIKISGIRFENLNDSHFIEVVASKNVTIENCAFFNSTDGDRCAINVDLARAGGFNGKYSKLDNTVVDGLTIRNCSFEAIASGVDSHVEIPGFTHKNIAIENCMFREIYLYCIQVLYWENVTLNNNQYLDFAGKEGKELFSSAMSKRQVFTNLIFENQSYEPRGR